MNETYKEYSQALFFLALENDNQSKYYEELKELYAIFENNPDYMEFLSSPAIELSQRKDAVDQAFSDSFSEHIVSFLKLLCDKKHILQFPECVNEYGALLKNYESISVAKITSATELTTSQKEALAEKLKKLSGRQVTLECFVDESILGGLVIEIDGKEIDSSLRSRLKEVKEVINR